MLERIEELRFMSVSRRLHVALRRRTYALMLSHVHETLEQSL